MVLLNNLGYPRIGPKRELKFAEENYWKGKITRDELFKKAADLRKLYLQTQEKYLIDLIPSSFSFYDTMLDMSLMVGAVPERYKPMTNISNNTEIDLYFAMARGYQKDGLDITAMAMSKWFDTNYHYIVPELNADQTFQLLSRKIIDEFNEGKQVLQNKTPKPVLIGPVTYLFLGKEKEKGFHRVDLISKLLPVYVEVLSALERDGAEWVQLDEPCLCLDITEKERAALETAYKTFAQQCPKLKIMLTTYFGALDDNLAIAARLPIAALHIDLVRSPNQLDDVLDVIPSNVILSLGVVDGRNIWKNDYKKSLDLIERAVAKLGKGRVMVAPSCSLLHSPHDLDFETDLQAEIKNWMAFSKQKLNELKELRDILEGNSNLLDANQAAIESRRLSKLIHKPEVKQRVAAITDKDAQRNSPYAERRKLQRAKFNFPLFPSTTIGSFPQTAEVRSWRAQFKKGSITKERYEELLEQETIRGIRIQESIGLDVLVHGEFERNDMVEYFGEQMEGFVFTLNGWVQSYGSRCVKPPIIFGDVSRPFDMTVRWSSFAQSVTNRPVKGMLTGPVTILQWSFVRDDQPRSETAFQIALGIRDEVVALEKAGITAIQIDEPAIREGLPLRKRDWDHYLNWAVKAFRVSSSGVRDDTHIATHMCYSEFNDIFEHIAAMDADLLLIETSKTQMKLLGVFAQFKYPNEIGPGLYDIHSPRVPTKEEMVALLEKAVQLLPYQNIWVNPDCGLKTRGWEETEPSLRNMVEAAREMRKRCPQ